MSETKKYTCKCESCKREFDEEEFKLTNDENKCILHCDKYEDTQLSKVFLHEIVSIVYKEKAVSIELKSIAFPAIDTKDLNRFKKEKIIFKNCKFQGKIKCSSKSIVPELEFEDCEFESQVLWENTTIEKKISFKNSIFKDDFINNECTFNKIVDLDGVIYESVSDFSKSIFKDKVKQKYTSYDGYTVFRDVTFEKELNLRDTIFNHKVNFLNIHKNANNEIVDVQNRETARIIKDSFEQQNNIIEANKFYALEMKEREKELEFNKEPFEWLVFKIHAWSSNHSQDWLLALYWILTLGFAFSLFNFYTLQVENKFIHFELSKVMGLFCLVSVGIFVDNICKKKDEIKSIFLLFYFYLLYTYETSDEFLTFFANTINPFSIMTGKDELTFGTLIFKIIIAYLIYQLIISIRQNTRRK